MKKYLKLLRVQHYIKNILVVLPLFFSDNLLNIEKVIIAIVGFLAFCLTSSSIYIINDIRDVEKDRKHPVKKNRPIASGLISVKKALIISIICITISIISIVAIYFFFEKINIAIAIFYLLLYFVLNIAYSFGLKNKPIIDIVILVSGFLIRVLFGGAIIQVKISEWLYLTIIAISFYLGLGKRRNELVKHSGDNTRSVLKYYTKEFLDKNMYSCMTLAICFYALWAMNYKNSLMLWTVPIVMILAMIYSMNVESNDSEGDPVDVILKNKWIILIGVIYVLMVFSIIYIF